MRLFADNGGGKIGFSAEGESDLKKEKDE